MSKKALIAMSGGVDSSVAAICTLQGGWQGVGATMSLHVGADGTCGSAAEQADARTVADRLGMPFHVLDYTADFARCVMEPFIAAYEQGDTPNPCIECNRHMKFARLYEFARQQGCDKVVTGHYARVEYDENRGKYVLKKAKNTAKDQTYVLYFLTQEQLAHTLFPLGEFESKEQVRQVAEEHGFHNARKRDSQDICFVPDGDYAAFIRHRTGKEYPPGDFVDESGRVLGRHKGLIRYTTGQRRGLGLALPAPLYVKGKNLTDNTVILSPEEGLYTTRLVADGFNWVSGETPDGPVRVTAKTRYSARGAVAIVTPLLDGRVEVVFDQPQRAVTRGQAVVLYSGDEVVGGGRICEV